MKTMLLLGVASSFVFALAPSTSLAQSNPSISSGSVAPTCRSVLQGGEFSQVDGIASPPCCFVSIEEDWYKANGVRLSSIYQRSNGDTYRAERCDLISENGRRVDQTTTGAIGGGSGVSLAGQPIAAGADSGGQVPPGAGIVAGSNNGGNIVVRPVANSGTGAGGGNTGGGNTGGGNMGGGNQGGNSGGNSDHGNSNGQSRSGHGDDTNPGSGSHNNNSQGAGGSGTNNPAQSNSGGGNGGGNGGEHADRGRGNNGFGNGGGDGSPNGMQDETR
jgi:hypothetical protein